MYKLECFRVIVLLHSFVAKETNTVILSITYILLGVQARLTRKQESISRINGHRMDSPSALKLTLQSRSSEVSRLQLVQPHQDPTPCSKKLVARRPATRCCSPPARNIEINQPISHEASLFHALSSCPLSLCTDPLSLFLRVCSSRTL